MWGLLSGIGGGLRVKCQSYNYGTEQARMEQKLMGQLNSIVSHLVLVCRYTKYLNRRPHSWTAMRVASPPSKQLNQDSHT